VGREPTNEELLAAIPADVGAFEVFYRRYIDRVIRFLAGRCQSPEDVADAAAATFLAVLDSIATFRPDLGNGEGWLFTIARNEALRLSRVRSREETLLGRLRGRELLSTDDADRITELIDAEREVARLGPALEAIRPSERTLLNRIVDQSLSPTEASRSLGIDPGAGRLRLSRLRASVRIHAQRAADVSTDPAPSSHEEDL
jgi:RNA polymerase sigma factor (sigma-70 family)